MCELCDACNVCGEQYVHKDKCDNYQQKLKAFKEPMQLEPIT